MAMGACRGSHSRPTDGRSAVATGRARIVAAAGVRTGREGPCPLAPSREPIRPGAFVRLHQSSDACGIVPRSDEESPCANLWLCGLPGRPGRAVERRKLLPPAAPCCDCSHPNDGTWTLQVRTGVE